MMPAAVKPRARFLEDLRERLGNLVQVLHLVWDASRNWTLVWGVLLLIQGTLPAAAVYLTKLLVDGIAGVAGGGFGWERVTPVAVPALLMAGVMLLRELLNGVAGYVRLAQSELIQDHAKKLIHTQAGAIDLEYFETPQYYDEMARASQQAKTRSVSVLESMGGLLQNTVTLVAIAGLLITYTLWLPLALLLSTLPALLVVVHHQRRQHSWWEETTEKRRWIDYYDLVLTIRQFAAELRIYGLNRHFQQGYRELRTELREGQLRLTRQQGVSRLLATLFAFLFTAGVMAWMIWRLMVGTATLGDLALFYAAFNQGQGLMRTLLSSLGQLYGDALFLRHLFSFLNVRSRMEQLPASLPMPATLVDGILIEGVQFRYPGSQQLALNGLDLFIPAGRVVAIVGPNGAGKSTLIKLLCRFYDPEAGSVKLDGVDLQKIRVEDVRRRMTVLFQDFVNYAGTIAQSISMGDLFSEHSAARIEAAARAGLALDFVQRLPQGFDTMLGKQFKGGMDLSGGQFQRVALARTFYRDAPIVMLDEPTSYMDSWAEAEWLDRFCEAMTGRTAVIVTHRFTTAMRADVIYVLDEGRVVESGNHQELLAQNGLYARSWSVQVRSERESGAGAGEPQAEPVASLAL
jgi:ATP-binding cassette, subfamily B, bacterial